MLEDFLKEYRFVELVDIETRETDYILILNRKHSVEEFQAEIDRARELMWSARKNKEYDDDDWSFIRENISSKFDWREFPKDRCVWF